MNRKTRRYLCLVLAVLLLVGAAGCSKVAEKVSKPATPAEQFSANLEKVLLEGHKTTQKVSAFSLETLFNPSAKIETRSNTTKTEVTARGSGENSGEEIGFTVTTNRNIKNGESSIEMAAKMGKEAAQTGGHYFKGDSLIVKKADASKPMVMYKQADLASPALAKVSALEKLNYIVSGKKPGSSSTDEWAKTLSGYTNVIKQKAQDTDFTKVSVTEELPGGAQQCDAVELKLTGAKAVDLLTTLLTTVKDDSDLQGIVGSNMQSDGFSLKGSLDKLNGMDAAEKESLSLQWQSISLGDKPVGMNLVVKTNKRDFNFKLIDYTKDREQKHSLDYKLFNGDRFSSTLMNTNTGGDKYKGTLTVATSKGSEKGDVSSEYTSTMNDTAFNIDGTFKFSQNGGKSGDINIPAASGTYSMKQNKQSKDQVTTAGTLEIKVSQDGKDQSVNVSLNQEINYTDSVTINAPQWIEGAGTTTTTKEEFYKALGIEPDGKDDTSMVFQVLFKAFN
ncbi:MAG: hypothetical protein HPY50_17710 [Firmicutes bacterium]|nr:hypothetical protein [Bacillota bacterium]